MSLPNGSASGTERLLACPASLAFPQVHRSDDAYTRKGHTVHGYIRNVLAGVPIAKALADVDDEHRETCRLIDWNKLLGDLEEVETEAAYALDVRARTARLIGHNVGRNYGELGEWEIPGTLDIAGRRKSDGGVVVADIKTGYQDVTAPAENGQGLFFGAVKGIILGVSQVTFRIAKLKPTGDIWHDAATYGAWEIDEYLDALESALDQAKQERRVYLIGGTPDVREGPWCGYCPAADACPAKTRLARAMLDELAPIDKAIATMPIEAAGRAYEHAHDRVAPVLERILDGLKERARREPIPLPDGRVLRAAPYEKDQLQTAALLDLARELGANDEQIKNCYRRTQIIPIRPCKGETAAKRRKAG